MHRIVIFGTGKYYENRKKDLIGEDIVAFLDNDNEKQCQILDGCCIYAPEKVVCLEYDYILLMSKDSAGMKKQLMELDVSQECIIEYNDYLKIKSYAELQVYSFNERQLQTAYDNVIVLLSHDLGCSGAPIVLLYMAKIMKENDYCPIIFSPRDGSLRKKILSEGITLIIDRNGFHPKSFLMNNLLVQARCVVCNTVELGWLVQDCAQICRKVIWWLHEGDASYGTNFAQYSNEKLGPNVKVYAVSELTRKAFLHHNTENEVCGLFPYGIPDMEYTPGMVEGKVIFAVIGTIIKRKGQDIMMEAIKLLSEKEQKLAEFWFIGKQGGMIEDEAVFEAIIHCGLDNVIYKGELDDRAMQKIYNDIDVVVCPSREDPLPVVLTEGMMNKKVCIMSDHTGTAAMVRDKEDGLICKAESAVSLTEQIRWVLNNRDKLDGIRNNGRKIYENMFSMERFRNRILNMISED